MHTHIYIYPHITSTHTHICDNSNWHTRAHIHTGCALPVLDTTLITGTCVGKTSLKDSESCSVSCDLTKSDDAVAPKSYNFSCSDSVLSSPTYRCIPSMWLRYFGYLKKHAVRNCVCECVCVCVRTCVC